ncbi:MAG: metallophosphoesterase [Clostridia bacterium]|nr:metallophosphoesterase [Clostridia bacterium]
MLFVTGDTHGRYTAQSIAAFNDEHDELTKDDIVVVAGDFSGVLEQNFDKNMDFYEKMRFTVAFVDGNHECYPRLEQCPKEVWHGGTIHRVRNNVVHLTRGQIFDLCGKRLLAFGGATSTDEGRTDGFDVYLDKEAPTNEDLYIAIDNLSKRDFAVDYIVTHTCDERAFYYPALSDFRYRLFPETQLLNYFETNVQYDHWYFGHFHIDAEINYRKTAIYQKIIRLA